MAGDNPALTSPYCGAPPPPAALIGSWNFDPPLIIGLGVVLALGLRRSSRPRLFLLAWAVLVLAFVSPFCALTTALFGARALHHVALVSLAAPLLALSVPLRGLPALFPLGWTALALLVWHIPPVYSAAWDSASIYWVMQGALILPAWAFWSSALAPFTRNACGEPQAGAVLGHALMVGGLAGVMGLIGAVLTFAPRALYPEHLQGTALWGTTPLADQQMAGLIMWVPGLAPLAVIAALMARHAWRQGQPA